MTDTVIVWFRRDLRLHDNTALARAVDNPDTIILPLFIFDPSILQSERVGAPRLKFMLKALEGIRTDLHKHQRELLVRYGDPVSVLRDLVEKTGAAVLYFNRDYTPFARKRDASVEDALDIPVETFDDSLLRPPGEVLKDDGAPYVVYTPFKKTWRSMPDKPPQPYEYDLMADRIHTLEGLDNHDLPSLSDLGYETSMDVPEARAQTAADMLSGFMDKLVYDYDEGRNALGNPQREPLTQTSSLSPYFRFGILSPRQAYWTAREAFKATTSEARRESVVTWVDELIWREFYTHILWYFPKVKTENFREKYDAVQWRDADDELEAWKTGCTGFPIVDAAMRQLTSIGWMHNRARMIMSSFLTKDLLIDWREGELFFMQHLLDGDLAANNGGWQWAAGTGTDAQPYFRIFNPISQSKKFDPDGEFIRCWVPELRDVPTKHIHEPWKMDTPPKDYPAPMVDHAAARKRALEAYQVTKDS